jgi:hypothetical protein
MISIRKFVVDSGLASSIGAAAVLALTSQAAVAAPPQITPTQQFTPSQACQDAFQAIRDGVVADRQEDAEEAQSGTSGDQAEDSSEASHFAALFAAARAACAPAVAAVVPKPEPAATLSPQCQSAVQALKAAWMRGRPTTTAQWTQLQMLAAAVKNACGWSWRL